MIKVFKGIKQTSKDNSSPKASYTSSISYGMDLKITNSVLEISDNQTIKLDNFGLNLPRGFVLLFDKIVFFFQLRMFQRLPQIIL